MKTPKEKLDFALTRMIIKAPFFGTLASQLKFQEAGPVVTNLQPETDSQWGLSIVTTPVERMATDGKTIFYNPDFVDTLNARQLATALAEAALYCTLHHTTRRGGRSSDKYQLACRYEVDEYLLKSNSEEFNNMANKSKVNPWDWSEDYPVAFKGEFAGLVAEQIYNRIQGDDSPGTPMPGGMCEVIDSPAETETELQEEEAKWDIALEQAASVAKAAGKLPASLELLVETAKPKIPWTYHLRQFARQFSKEDYSYLKPNMAAFIASEGEIIIPGLYSEALGPIVAVVDTSGSIYGSQSLLDEFIAEIIAIHREMSPSELHFMDVDTSVYDHRIFGPQDTLDLSVRGGGGTDFREPFKILKNSNVEPACLIYFTDMYGVFPEEKPNYPVLWVSYSSEQKAPFGTVINAQ